jgi:L-ascorbate metabolism protein UlaG (beta-lactamase superfamily)
MNYYLKPNIKTEPLMWQWYAWTYLIPPVSAGCNIVERNLKIMKSYAQFPKIHEQAIKNPDMMGGPFMELDEQHVGLVKNLINETEKDCATYIELSNDLKDFQRMLQKEAIGNSLEPFYDKTPESLKGLVELVYDTENHPQVLLIEKLIYNKYYSNKGQSVSLAPLESDKRPFIMSTPRVLTNNELNITIPFIAPVWDELFKAKQEPTDIKELANKLNVQSNDMEYFESLFTDVAPQNKPDRNYAGDEVKVRYFGHACVLLQTKNVSIMTDPVISYDIPGEAGTRYTYMDLPDTIDYVLLTHNHQDHVMFETLLQIRHKVKTVIVPRNRKGALEDPSLKLILNKIGFKDVIEIDNLESIDIPDGEIMGTPFLGEHSDLNIQTKTAHFIRLKDKKFLLAADSNNMSPKMYKYLFEYLGGIDVLFLGMECDGAPLTWLYGPLLSQPLKRSFDNERQLSGSNYEKAWALAKESKCTQAYVYAMGMEPWLTYIMALQYEDDSIQMTESKKFVENCIKNNIESERLFMKREWLG